MINLGVMQPPILWFLGVLLAIPVASTAPAYLWPEFYTNRERQLLPLRVRSWLIMVAMFAFALALGPVPVLVFIGFVSYMALKAYFSFVPTRRIDRPILLLAYLSIPLQFTLVGFDRYRLFVTFIPVIMLLVNTAAILARGDRTGYLSALGSIHLGLMITVFGLSHMAYLLVLPVDVNPDLGGAGLVLFLVVISQLSDVGRYLVDRVAAYDRPASRPVVKPTRDGLLGGIATAVVLAVVTFSWLTSFDILQALLAGLLIGVGTVLGNTVMNLIREDLSFPRYQHLAARAGWCPRSGRQPDVVGAFLLLLFDHALGRYRCLELRLGFCSFSSSF